MRSAPCSFPAEKSASAFNTVAADDTAVDIATAGGFTLRLSNPAGGGGTNCVSQLSGDSPGFAFRSVNYEAPLILPVPADSFVNTGINTNGAGVVTIGQNDNTGAAQFEFYIFDLSDGSCVIRGTGLGDPAG